MVTTRSASGQAPTLTSCLYVGNVRHRRFSPKPHAFTYPLFMTLLDLDELPHVFKGRWLWSIGRPNLAWFRRKDYFDGGTEPLAEAVRAFVKERTGKVLVGPIRLLTHLRFFGYCFNPISLYFCYGADASRVEAIIAEVTNTPWNERHRYVLDTPTTDSAADPGGRKLHYRFAKSLHVSPFLDMDYAYDLRLNEPDRTLAVHLENWSTSGVSGGSGDVDGNSKNGKVLDATLTMERKPLTGANLAGVLLRFPFITGRIVAAIYWQAVKLWWKGIPYVPHAEPATVFSAPDISLLAQSPEGKL
jgi:uncharacterized protein